MNFGCGYWVGFPLIWLFVLIVAPAAYGSDSAFYVLLCVGIVLYFLIPILVKISESKTNEERQKAESEKKQKLQKEYGHLSPEEIIFNEQIEYPDKLFLLETVHSYSYSEAEELYDTAQKEARKAKLSEVKRKISQKAQEAYGNIPSDDERKPIPEDVKMYVWQRDRGKCVKCGSQESLEFDHIIPFAKGGSNTERNIQLLCEKCNRSKSDNI